MRLKASVVAAALVAASVAAYAQTQKPKPAANFPQVIVNATWVYVTSMRGDAFNPRLDPEDRKAIFDVEDALKSWGRYKLVTRAEEADIVFLVRRGRIAAAQEGVTIGGGSNRATGIGNVTGMEMGSPDDTMMVVPGGRNPLDATPLWRQSKENGLRAPDLTLFHQFKKQVDEAAAKKKP